jgi:hypothetical protein
MQISVLYVQKMGYLSPARSLHLLQWSTFIDAYFKGFDVVYVRNYEPLLVSPTYIPLMIAIDF